MTSAVKVRFLHGRPSAHPEHIAFATAVGADFEFIDFRMRWQDRARSRMYVIASWLINAATLPSRRDYDVFLIDNLHVGPVLMKRLFLRRDQKIVVHLGSHTPYFLLTHRFGRLVERLHVWALRSYDALICEGRMTVEMVEEVLGDDHPPIYEVYGGVAPERLELLQSLEPDLEGRRVIFVGGGPSEFRLHYKGLDLMVDAFSLAAQADPAIEFDVIGEWDPPAVNAMLARMAPADRGRLHFRGAIRDLAKYVEALGRGSLYLHCSRGDAFPGATIEAMMAGLVPLVSDWTGTKQIVAQVDQRLIAHLEHDVIAERILWYFALSAQERRRLSDLGRVAAGPYTAEAATAHYKTTFERLCADLGVLARSRG